MQTLKQLFSHTQASQMVARYQAESAMAQALWQKLAPSDVLAYTHATTITNGQTLNVVADNGVAANKVKLLSATLLTKLENLAKTPDFQYARKVTAIRVKVQVKSSSMQRKKAPRKLTEQAANHLNELVEQLEDSDLKLSLKKLASRHKDE